MARLFWLSDKAWAALEPHLPHGRPGKPSVDDRRVISGILHVLKTGCRWRHVLPEYGPATTVYNRYNRWSGPAADCGSACPSRWPPPAARPKNF
jgi:transposase